MDDEGRERDLQRVFDNIQTITRRINDRTRLISQPLTFVEYSLLRFIGTHPASRAIDLAAAFSLNRSTVSRQVGTLIDLGFAQYGQQRSGRGRILELTDHGKKQLAAFADAHRAEVTERLADWSDDEVRELAAGLEKYNEPPQSSGTGRAV